MVRPGSLFWLGCALTFLTSPLGAAPQDPVHRALAISQADGNPAKVQRELLKLVSAMKPSKDGLITRQLLNDTKGLLGAKGHAPFQFRLGAIDADKQARLVAELVKALPGKRSGEGAFVPAEWAGGRDLLFPAWPMLPLLSAVGSSWEGHHVYPGGLLYHLYTTAMTNLKTLESYEVAFRHRFSQSEKDLAVLSGIWHDVGKAWAITWNADGTVTHNEGKIAWASSHHVISSAEMLVRGYPKALVMAVAASHFPANEKLDTFSRTIDCLVATAVLAGRPIAEVGLEKTETGYKLSAPPSILMILQHLGDGDWILTEQALRTVRPKLTAAVAAQGLEEAEKNWAVHEVLTRYGEVVPYQALTSGGEEALRALISK